MGSLKLYVMASMLKTDIIYISDPSRSPLLSCLYKVKLCVRDMAYEV